MCVKYVCECARVCVCVVNSCMYVCMMFVCMRDARVSMCVYSYVYELCVCMYTYGCVCMCASYILKEGDSIEGMQRGFSADLDHGRAFGIF